MENNDHSVIEETIMNDNCTREPEREEILVKEITKTNKEDKKKEVQFMEEHNDTKQKGRNGSVQNSATEKQWKYNEKKKNNKNFTLLAVDPSTIHSTMKIRGNQMIDKRIICVTPVQIEFNVPKEATAFNIRAETEALLQKMWEGHKNLKVGSVVNAQKQWTKHESLPENEEFHLHFQTKELTFVRSPRKILVNISMESERSIQELKYMPQVRNYIQSENIWIKIDWLNIKIESSPGFITKVNP